MRRRRAHGHPEPRPGAREPTPVTRRVRAGRYLAVVAAAALAMACSEPDLPDGPVEDTGTDPAPDAEEADNPQREDLRDQLAEFGATIEAATDELGTAAAASSAGEARAAADRALAALLEGEGTGGSTAPLLPADSPERGQIGDRGDALGTTLALARDVGGGTGEAVVGLLRDEVAGDLGAWERDAAGVVDTARSAAGGGGSLDQRTERILELPGEATRALAWTLIAAETSDGELATTAAERAASHLELIAIALDELLDQLPETEAAP